MAVYKDGDKWRVVFRFTNWQGERKQTQKRGFTTKREAQMWEREELLKQGAKLDMTFGSFFEIYEADKRKRVKENTWESKSHIIRTKIVPYFENRKMEEIEPKDIIAWQNELLSYRDENGEPYAPTYLKTIHAQLSAIFNHAVRFYHLTSNPAQKAGSMGSEEHKEMLFWTKEEYLKFADAMMDKPQSYYAFEMLYWCGIRMGELLALTPADFDFDKCNLRINKSYQRLKGQDVITSPKTPKSNRVISNDKENENYLPLIDGADIHPYTYSEPKIFFNYLPENIKSGGDWKVYSRERIVVRQIGQIPVVGLCKENILASNTLYSIWSKDEKYDLRFILACLNSNIMKKYWTAKYSDNKALFPKIKGFQLKELPIPVVSLAEQKPVNVLVDELIERKFDGEDTSDIENEIESTLKTLYGVVE